MQRLTWTCGLIDNEFKLSEFDGSLAQIIISDNLDEITMAKGNCITRPDILVIHENEKVHLVCEEILPDAKRHADVSTVANELSTEELGRFRAFIDIIYSAVVRIQRS